MNIKNINAELNENPISVNSGGNQIRFNSYSKLKSFFDKNIFSWEKYKDHNVRYISSIAQKNLSSFNQYLNDIMILKSSNAENFKNQISTLRSAMRNNYLMNTEEPAFRTILENINLLNDPVFRVINDYLFVSKRVPAYRELQHPTINITAALFLQELFRLRDGYLFNSYENVLQKTISSWDDYILLHTGEIENSQIKASEQIESLVSSLEKKVEDANSVQEKFVETSNNRLEEVEKSFTEKIRISEPVKYWTEYSRKLFTRGVYSSILAFILGAIIVIASICLIDHLPTKIKIYGSGGFVFSSVIKWFLFFSGFFSTLIYLLRLVVKFAISSFHLERDAKEREQLAHQYLALHKAGLLKEENDRSIVLQALFSRSESGLLKGDSAPTMPGAVESLIGMTSSRGNS